MTDDFKRHVRAATVDINGGIRYKMDLFGRVNIDTGFAKTMRHWCSIVSITVLVWETMHYTNSLWESLNEVTVNDYRTILEITEPVPLETPR